jgi:hypothetical protein
MPWGNRVLLFRDPDEKVVNLFAPVTTRPVPSQPLWPERLSGVRPQVQGHIRQRWCRYADGA